MKVRLALGGLIVAAAFIVVPAAFANGASTVGGLSSLKPAILTDCGGPFGCPDYGSDKAFPIAVGHANHGFLADGDQYWAIALNKGDKVTLTIHIPIDAMFEFVVYTPGFVDNHPCSYSGDDDYLAFDDQFGQGTSHVVWRASQSGRFVLCARNISGDQYTFTAQISRAPVTGGGSGGSGSTKGATALTASHDLAVTLQTTLSLALHKQVGAAVGKVYYGRFGNYYFALGRFGGVKGSVFFGRKAPNGLWTPLVEPSGSICTKVLPAPLAAAWKLAPSGVAGCSR